MIKKIFSSLSQIVPAFLFSGSLIFLCFFYRYHFHFIEQLQIFQFTSLYLKSYLNEPGFLAALIGDFLIQFYKIPFLAGFIITLILFLIYVLLRKLLRQFGVSDYWFLLPVFPVVLIFLMHCSVNYRLPATVGIALSMALVHFWIRFRKFRTSVGVIFIVFSWFAFATASIIFVFILISYELSQKKGAFSFLASGIYLIALILTVYLGRQYVYIISWEEAFLPISYCDWRYEIPGLLYCMFAAIPVILITGIVISRKNQWSKKVIESKQYSAYQLIIIAALLYFTLPDNISFGIEQNCRFDYQVRNKNWEKVIEIAVKTDSIQSINLPYINLALSHNGELLNSMFNYSPVTLNSLVPPKSENMVFNTICMEVYYHLGWTSLAQVHGIMANQETYRGRNVRCIQRLTEMEIVNGNYKLAQKYLDILDKTLFYSKWSKEKRMFLENDEMIRKDDDYREIRKGLPKKDLLNGSNIMVDLKQYLDANPGSKVAFEYMIAALMLNKDNSGIVNFIEKQSGVKYADYPILLQQVGMMYYLYKKGDENVIKQFNISNEVFNQFKDFYTIMDINRGNIEMARNLIMSKYAKTYWYYLYFVK